MRRRSLEGRFDLRGCLEAAAGGGAGVPIHQRLQLPLERAAEHRVAEPVDGRDRQRGLVGGAHADQQALPPVHQGDSALLLLLLVTTTCSSCSDSLGLKGAAPKQALA